MSRRREKIDTGGGERLGSGAFSALDALDLGEAKGKPAPDSRKDAGKASPKAPGKGARVELRREKSGRGGKTVTTLSAFPSHLPLRDLEALALGLKKRCACGGSVKERVIELQGDVRDRVEPHLEKLGYRPVRAGG